MPNPFSIHPVHNQSLSPEDPLITVVIPTYNRHSLVLQAVASVVAQTYTNWELIVADDGSDDGTSESIIAMHDSRISVLKMPHTGNIATLRNAGVRAGSGEWLTFLDSDDEWVPQRLHIHLEMMLKERKRWGYGRFELMNNEKHRIPNKAGVYRPISGWIAKDVLTTEASVNIGTLLVERSLFEEAGGFNDDEALLYREDYELVLRLALKAEALAVSDLILRVREHGSRATNSFDDAHDRTASVYQYFIRTRPAKELEKIARRRMAGELAESAVQRIRHRKYMDAIRRLGRALANGDNLRHLLSAVRRGLTTPSQIRTPSQQHSVN